MDIDWKEIRKAFEQWSRHNGYRTNRQGDGYVSASTDAAWCGWKAAMSDAYEVWKVANG